MASTFTSVILLIVSAVIGVGVTMFSASLLPNYLDQQTQIISAIVLTIFAYVSLYFMSKSRG